MVRNLYMVSAQEQTSKSSEENKKHRQEFLNTLIADESLELDVVAFALAPVQVRRGHQYLQQMHGFEKEVFLNVVANLIPGKFDADKLFERLSSTSVYYTRSTDMEPNTTYYFSKSYDTMFQHRTSLPKIQRLAEALVAYYDELGVESFFDNIEQCGIKFQQSMDLIQQLLVVDSERALAIMGRLIKSDLEEGYLLRPMNLLSSMTLRQKQGILTPAAINFHNEMNNAVEQRSQELNAQGLTWHNGVLIKM